MAVLAGADETVRSGWSAQDAVPVFAGARDVTVEPLGGNDAAWLLTGADTAGRASAVEIVGRPGADAITLDTPVNRYLFVVAGDWTISLATQERALVQDDSVFLPAGTDACIRLTGGEEGKLFLLTSGALR